MLQRVVLQQVVLWGKLQEGEGQQVAVVQEDLQ
jgi:hypothetical protein